MCAFKKQLQWIFHSFSFIFFWPWLPRTDGINTAPNSDLIAKRWINSYPNWYALTFFFFIFIFFELAWEDLEKEVGVRGEISSTSPKSATRQHCSFLPSCAEMWLLQKFHIFYKLSYFLSHWFLNIFIAYLLFSPLPPCPRQQKLYSACTKAYSFTWHRKQDRW